MAWLTNYYERYPITIQNANVDSDLTDFPVFIEFDDDSNMTSAKSDGTDIRFTSSDGTTELKYHRLYWNGGNGSNASGKFRVKCSPTAASAATIYMYWGYSGASDGEDKANTYDANYLVFANLNESSSTYDDAAGSNDGTGAGDPTRENGKFWYCQHYDGSSDNIKWGTVTEASHAFISLWVYFDDLSNNIGSIVQQDSNGSGDSDFHLWNYGSDGTLQMGSPNYRREIAHSGNFSNATWYHIGMYMNLSSGSFDVTFYKNGSSIADSSSTVYIDQSNGELNLGYADGPSDYYFDGKIETFKFSNTDRGAAWNKFEYHNEGEADHELTFGTYEKYTSVSPSVLSSASSQPALSVSGGTGTSVSPLVLSVASSQPSPTVKYGTGISIGSELQPTSVACSPLTINGHANVSPGIQSASSSQPSPTVVTNSILSASAQSASMVANSPTIRTTIVGGHFGMDMDLELEI